LTQINVRSLSKIYLSFRSLVFGMRAKEFLIDEAIYCMGHQAQAKLLSRKQLRVQNISISVI
jgi:hypothetical protein